MEPVVLVGPLTDISLNLARLFIQKGIPVYIVTDSVEEWRRAAPDVFSGQNIVTEDQGLTFAPSYMIIVPGSLAVPATLPASGRKVVSVISHQLKHNLPSVYESLVFPSYADVHPQLGADEKVNEILRHLFSFGGNTTIFTDVQKVSLPEPEPPPVSETEATTYKPAGEDLPLFLKGSENRQRVTVERRPVPSRFKKHRRWWVVLTIIIGLVLLPFTILGVATALTLVGIKLITMGELSLARTAFAASGQVSSVAKVIPGSDESAYMLQRITTTGKQGTYVIEQVNQILEGVFSGKTYPLVELSSNLQQDLQVIHRELSFLETELNKENSLVTNFIPLNSLTEVRAATAAGADIAGRLPSLLGMEEQKTYMVLLQNNMELRPTGGFIGSFALLHFSGGRLIDAPVFDVYSADGQLKGHVEPPAAIKDYLGEANWFLRDSNWDPDFPTSANRAEWFLDKTLEIPIHGVIAIDLEFVRQLIAEQGELQIADFDLSLNKDNFYEVLQNEVHKDFFPGSRKKAAILTATMNALMNNLLNQVKERDVTLAAVTANALDGRHIQVHLEDPVLQQQIKVLGWAGEAVPEACGDNCEQIWLGMVEANVGVNKANYFIERSAKLDSKWLNDQWEHELTITFVNTASGEAVDSEHNYETYLRVLTAKDAKFDRVFVQNETGRSSSVPDIYELEQRKEAGVLVTVPAGETKVVTFLWSDKADVDLSKEGVIELFWRKQAGIDQHPIAISLNLPNKEEMTYNSNLEQDFIERITIR